MEIEMSNFPEADNIYLFELNFTDHRVEPNTKVRIGLKLGPDGKTWTMDGDMPLDQAAKQFIDYCVDEANRQEIMFVRGTERGGR